MQKVKTFCLMAVALLLLSTFVSCIYDNEECPPSVTNKVVRISVDWSKFDKEVPSGMTVMVFPKDEQTSKSVLTNDITHAFFSLATGHYSTFVFNQSTTEFGTMTFVNMDSYASAKAVVVEKTSNWFARADKERLAVEPEWLAAGHVDDFDVGDEDTTYVDMEAHNAICTVTVTVRVPGIYNLRSVRGSLTGIANGYLLGLGKTTTDTVTYVMEKWTKAVDKNDATMGTLTTTFHCFGLPDSHQDVANANRLYISLLLVDNKTQKDFVFDVGDKFEKGGSVAGGNLSGDANLQVSLNVNVELADPLPDVKPVDGADGAFDVEIKDWGTPEDVNMNM